MSILVLASASIVYAQPADAHARALELYQRAREAFGSEDYREAASLLERAYAIEPAPVLLLNRARALEQAGEACEASLIFGRYLTEEPSPTPALRARGVALEEACTAATPPPSEPVITLPPATPPARSPDLLPSALVLGTGLAALATATVFGIVALERHDYAGRPETSMLAARDAAALSNDLGIAASIVWAAGGTVALVGFIWLLVEMASGQPPSPAAGLPTFRF